MNRSCDPADQCLVRDSEPDGCLTVGLAPPRHMRHSTAILWLVRASCLDHDQVGAACLAPRSGAAKLRAGLSAWDCEAERRRREEEPAGAQNKSATRPSSGRHPAANSGGASAAFASANIPRCRIRICQALSGARFGPRPERLAQFGQRQAEAVALGLDERLLPRPRHAHRRLGPRQPGYPSRARRSSRSAGRWRGLRGHFRQSRHRAAAARRAPASANLVPQIEQLHRQRRQSLSSSSWKACERDTDCD